MAHSELKKCPFCGGKAEIRMDSVMVGFNESDDFYTVKCTACRMSGSRYGRLDGDSKRERIEKAITAWNRRADNGT